LLEPRRGREWALLHIGGGELALRRRGLLQMRLRSRTKIDLVIIVLVLRLALSLVWNNLDRRRRRTWWCGRRNQPSKHTLQLGYLLLQELLLHWPLIFGGGRSSSTPLLRLLGMLVV